MQAGDTGNLALFHKAIRLHYQVDDAAPVTALPARSDPGNTATIRGMGGPDCARVRNIHVRESRSLSTLLLEAEKWG
jgi:hypothetical protein